MDWFLARNVRVGNTLAILAKITRTRTKVRLQYIMQMFLIDRHFMWTFYNIENISIL